MIFLGNGKDSQGDDGGLTLFIRAHKQNQCQTIQDTLQKNENLLEENLLHYSSGLDHSDTESECCRSFLLNELAKVP